MKKFINSINGAIIFFIGLGIFLLLDGYWLYKTGHGLLNPITLLVIFSGLFSIGAGIKIWAQE